LLSLSKINIKTGIEAFLEDVPELVEGKEVPTVSPLKKGLFEKKFGFSIKSLI